MAKRNQVDYYEGHGHDVAMLASAGLLVSLENDRPAGRRSGTYSPSSAPPAAKQSVSMPDAAQYPSIGGDIMPWGDGNDFPQRITELYNKDPLIPPTLGKVASMIQGRGIIAVEEDLDDDGNEIARPIRANTPIGREINTFLSSVDFKRYLREMSSDAAWFFNGFPEMILSKDRSKIVQLHPLNAEEVRWCRMTEEGTLPNVYLNANWPRCNDGSPSTKKIPAIDPYNWDRVNWLRNSSFYNCVYPISYPTPGKRFYSLPHHYSIVESGWLDIRLAVPEFKKYLMKNQMTLKYHWKVDKDYWAQLYGEQFTKGTPAQKRTLKLKWLEGMNKSLTDVTSAGNSILTDMSWDPVKQIFKDHITVTPIADLMKDGKYIDDYMEAAVTLLYSLNVDPTIVGFAGGGKTGARSGGSDKREAYLIALQMLNPFREMVIEPLHFMAEFNGWKDEFPTINFRVKDTILTTLDTGAGTAKKLS
jgi:hypothetical protein